MTNLELLKDNNWFIQHPEKVAGEEYKTSGFMFPLMVRGSKEDVLRVVGLKDKPKTIEDFYKKNNLKKAAENLTYEQWKVESKKWNDYTDKLSDKLNSVAEKGEMGLAKRTPEFIKAKKEFDNAFIKLQSFNKSTPKKYSKKRFDEKTQKANQNYKALEIAKAKAIAVKIKLKLAKTKISMNNKEIELKVGSIIKIDKTKVDKINFRKYFDKELEVTKIVTKTKPILFNSKIKKTGYYLPYLLSEDTVFKLK